MSGVRRQGLWLALQRPVLRGMQGILQEDHQQGDSVSSMQIWRQLRHRPENEEEMPTVSAEEVPGCADGCYQSSELERGQAGRDCRLGQVELCLRPIHIKLKLQLVGRVGGVKFVFIQINNNTKDI